MLFLLYVNDLPNAVQSVPRLFADDTCLMLSHSNPLTLQEKLNQEVSLMRNWCNSNKLTINTEKCHVIILHLNQFKCKGFLCNVQQLTNYVKKSRKILRSIH